MSNLTANLLNRIITEQEGGFVLSSDADGGDGGWTFAGVTAKSFWSYDPEQHRIDKQTVAGIITNTASIEYSDFIQQIYEIYEEHYIPASFEELPSKIQGPFLSASINSGLKEAVILLQTSINSLSFSEQHIAVDGACGNETIQAAEECEPEHLLEEFLFQWNLHYADICVANPAKIQFLKGWLRRSEYWRF